MISSAAAQKTSAASPNNMRAGNSSGGRKTNTAIHTVPARAEYNALLEALAEVRFTGSLSIGAYNGLGREQPPKVVWSTALLNGS